MDYPTIHPSRIFHPIHIPYAFYNRFYEARSGLYGDNDMDHMDNAQNCQHSVQSTNIGLYVLANLPEQPCAMD